ncbi:MAG: AMP-binding protein [Pseudonocardiaceae bacterium]
MTTRSATSLADLLVRNVQAHPQHPALVDAERVLTYRTVGLIVRSVSRYLHELGVGRGDQVAILGPRDARLCALMFGVLRSGATAVLVDTTWSEPELSNRLDAVAVACALSTDGSMRAPAPWRTDIIDVETPAAHNSPDPMAGMSSSDIAYLSFTSGSAGEPKAVAVTHGNAVHYAQALRDRLGFETSSAPCIALVTTLAADLGHTTWLLALATAGSVYVMSDRDARDPAAFWAALHSAGVSVLKTTPSHLTALVQGRPADACVLDTVLLGGEPLPRSFAAALLARHVTRRVINHYGPTETTVGATCFIASTVADLPADEILVPIGSPIGAVDLSLLDGAGEPVPDGTAGELFISGRGVAAGYFGRPGETARHFLARDAGRMYRTGDICRRRGDGNLVFVRRADRQVKIRGFRVDPAEIERALEAVSGIGQAAVVVRETPMGNRLLAAVRLSGPAGAPEALDAVRSQLLEAMPEYAVPQPIFAFPELPIASTGKLDRGRIEAMVSTVLDEQAGAAHGDTADVIDTGLAHAVAKLWAGALGVTRVDPDADIVSLGGDSILVMRTIAFLRRRGYRITFDDFYVYPTPVLLASVARLMDNAVPGTVPEPDRAGEPPAPAQRWLFGRHLDDLRHWNQSVVLSCGTSVGAAALSQAVLSVLERHTALRRPIGPDGPGVIRAVNELVPVSFSALPRSAGAIAAVIEAMCTELHHSIDPASGHLVRVHLFSGGSGVEDRLAVVVHHLVIDGLSWRILLDDIAYAYRMALSGKEFDLPETADYYRWAARPGELPAVCATIAPRLPADEVHAAAEPASLVWALDRTATARLVRRHGGAQRLESLLLSALAAAVLHWNGQSQLGIEVETHGRDVRDGGEYLDTIGWFTAVKWVVIDRCDGPDDADATHRAANLAQRLRDSPVLPMDVKGRRPEVGFNFLGTFQLPDEPTLAWSVAAEQAGTARCVQGDMLYRLRLSARIVEGCLVTDLVYTRPAISSGSAHRIIGRFARTVSAAAGVSTPPHAGSARSTSGQVLLSPARKVSAGVRVISEPPRVLLTGVTGYLGGHLLSALLERNAQVTCLVRGERDADARRRLNGSSRDVAVIAGDITRDDLGLSRAGLARARDCQVIIHAAADTRLVASPTELERTNHAAVSGLLAWIDAETPGARFHHVSTLGVAGSVDGPVRRFGEADLRIGQFFRTPYERSKFGGELAVRSWAAQGRQCYIYRSGHIAAHSRTGKFQRNIADNRIYQLIRGYLLAGAAPRRPAVTFGFSYVDTVAVAMAAIATHPHTAPGVYHVETPHLVTHDDLMEWTVAAGYRVVLTDDNAFAAALGRAERCHPTAARLALAWSDHDADRNVVIDSSYTVSVLNRLGVRFTAPTPQWWAGALAWGAEAGYFLAASTAERTA